MYRLRRPHVLPNRLPNHPQPALPPKNWTGLATLNNTKLGALLAPLTAKLAAVKLGKCLWTQDGGGTAAANAPPFVTYRSGGSGIGGNFWKAYVVTPPANLCGGGGKGVTARLTRATVTLANNEAGAAVSTSVRAGLFAVDAANAALPPTSPPAQLAQSAPVAVTVPFCPSPCTPPAPSPSKPVVSLTLGSAKSSALTITPGAPFAFGIATDYTAGPGEYVKWANVVDATDTEAPVVGASGFVVSTSAWRSEGSAAWVDAGAGNTSNQLTLEFQCFAGCLKEKE